MASVEWPPHDAVEAATEDICPGAPGQEFHDPRRIELINKLEGILKSKTDGKVSTTLWAILWISDVEKLEQFVQRAAGLDPFTLYAFIHADDIEKLVPLWTQRYQRRSSSVGGSAPPSAPSSRASTPPGGLSAPTIPPVTPTHNLQERPSSPENPSSSQHPITPSKMLCFQKERDLCLARDKQQCIVTGLGDFTNVAHIYPSSMRNMTTPRDFF
ncbi:hypothetical protein VTN96DRAFT_3434 [Rasamsonia emersonii]